MDTDDRFGKYSYKTLNDNLARVRRTGSAFTKDLKGGDFFLSLEELREALRISETPYRRFLSSSEADNMSDDEEEMKEEEAKRTEETLQILERAGLLTPEDERRVLKEEIFHRFRRSIYDCENEFREADGKQPWYIMEREEIDLVGFVLPYNLVTHPDHTFIKAAIEKEGRRIQEFKAAGKNVKVWSQWDFKAHLAGGSTGSVVERLV